MKLVAGSYERYLWGWRLEKKSKRKKKGDGHVQDQHQEQQNEATETRGGLQPIFSYPAHLGPIKCIASWGSVLATGGADDTIKVFDSSAQRDMGTLMHHTGAVTALALYGLGASPYPNNLLSGSDDGTVCIWDAESWLLYKTMKGHKRGVSDLTIHPSGRVALSVGRDSHLNMYNLLKGRQSFTVKLPSEASLIRFSPQEGSTYSSCAENVVTVHDAEDGRALCTLSHEKRVLCMGQQEDAVLYTGGEDCTIRLWDTRSGQLALSIPNTHTSRIRGLCVLGSTQGAEDSPLLVATASSDGFVRVWDTRFAKVDKESVSKPVMEAETKARLTCLAGCLLENSNVRSVSTKSGPSEEQVQPSSKERPSRGENLRSKNSDIKHSLTLKVKKKRKATNVPLKEERLLKA